MRLIKNKHSLLNSEVSAGKLDVWDNSQIIQRIIWEIIPEWENKE